MAFPAGTTPLFVRHCCSAAHRRCFGLTGRILLVLLFVLAACTGFLRTASAQEVEPDAAAPTRDLLFEAAIHQKLTDRDPAAAELFRQATADYDAGDLDGALSGYLQVLELVPDAPDALRRLSYVELARGELAAAIAYARQSLAVEESPYAHEALARVLLETAEPPVASVPMKLPATVLFTTPEPVSQMPAPWFPETTLPGPIVLNEDAPVTITPPRPFGSAASPVERVPTRDPVTLLSWVAAPEIHTPYSVFPDRTLPGPMVLSCAPSEICTPCFAFGAALVPSLPTPHQQSRTVLPEAFGWSMAMPTHGERTMPSPRTVQPDA